MVTLNWVTLNWVTLIDIKTNVVQSYPYPRDNFEHTRYLKKTKKLNIIDKEIITFLKEPHTADKIKLLKSVFYSPFLKKNVK